MSDQRRAIILVAPNLSMKMGGEALKALLICRQLVADGHRVIQIAHERCRAELGRDHPDLDVRFVADGKLQSALFRLLGVNWFVAALDTFSLHRMARRVAREERAAIVHFTSPISPVFPRMPVPEAPVVIGPVNGNIYHPPAFADRMQSGGRLRRLLLPIAQRVLSSVFRGKRHAAAILVAGGERTRESLSHSDVRRDRLVDTIDSGVANELEEYAPPRQEGRNASFVSIGRLIELKAIDLVIRAIAAADADITLDVIGDGERRAAWEALAAELGVGDRVRFLGWLQNGPALFERLRTYRGFVFSSLSEANGIVVQEAMMLGLPVIALAWGGQMDLLDEDTALLVRPTSPEAVVEGFAEAMNRLAGDPELAARLGAAARASGDRRGFVWSRLARQWVDLYDRVLAERGLPPLGSEAAAPRAGVEEHARSRDVDSSTIKDPTHT